MILEKAQVIAIDARYAWVATDRQSVCSGCAVNKGCGTSVLARVVGRRHTQIRVANHFNAGVGDTVTIGMSEAGLLKSALIVYALPLAGVVLSTALATAVFGGPLSEAAGIGAGTAGFVLGILFARWFSSSRMDDPRYHPVIVSVDRFSREHSPPQERQGLLAP